MFKTADKNARSNLLRLCSGGLFRTQSNIYDRAAKKNSIADVRPGSKYASM